MKKIFKEWGNTALILFGIAIFGFVIRFVNLTILPVFADEAIYVRWAQVMANEPTLRFLPLTDGKQPLYMWALMFVIKYFGNPLFIGRLVSIFTGLGTAFGVFTLSFLLFKDKRTALFSTALYMLSPFTFFFDRMALVDSMLACFTVWTVVFSILTFKNNRLDFALITGILLGFASLTKSAAIFTAVLIPAVLVLENTTSNIKKFLQNTIKPILLLLVIYIVSFAMYNIQRLGPSFHMLSLRTADYMYPISYVFASPLDPLLPHLKDYFFWILILGPFPLLMLVILGLYVGYKKHFKELFLLILFAFLPVVIESAIGKVFTARYVLFTIPFLFVIAGLAFEAKSKILKNLTYLIFIVFVFLSLKNIYFLLINPEKTSLPIGERAGYLEEWTAGQGIKEISEYIKNEHLKNPEKEIVVGTEGYFGTLPDGLQIYLESTKNVKVVGIGLGVSEVPESLKSSVDFGTKTYLVINKSRYLGDGGGLKLIASYKKADRNPKSDNFKNMGAYDELLFFEVIK